MFQQQRQSQPSAMVSTSASPYPFPSQLAQLQASHQGTPLVLPQATSATAATATAAATQLPYGSFINPGKNPQMCNVNPSTFTGWSVNPSPVSVKIA